MDHMWFVAAIWLLARVAVSADNRLSSPTDLSAIIAGTSAMELVL